MSGNAAEHESEARPTRGLTPLAGPEDVSYAGKTVVLCLGNPYLRDDGIGCRVAEELRGSGLGENVLVETCRNADLSLLWEYEGASRIIVVDAMKAGTPPGTVSRYKISASETPLHRLRGLHTLQMSDMYDIASQAGLLKCPVTIVGVEPKDCSVGEGLSTELVNAVPLVLAEVNKELALPDPRAE